MKFTGHERGSWERGGGGGDYMHQRFCSPVTGRFLSFDIGRVDYAQPQSWNRYTYALDNPLYWFTVNKTAGGHDGHAACLLAARRSRRVCRAASSLRFLSCQMDWDSDNWCLLAEDHIFWAHDGLVRHLRWSDFQGVDAKEGDWKELSRGERATGTLCDLLIKDCSGNVYVLRTEAGAGFCLLWSALAALPYINGLSETERSLYVEDLIVANAYEGVV
jgi:hypothetical protein